MRTDVQLHQLTPSWWRLSKKPNPFIKGLATFHALKSGPENHGRAGESEPLPNIDVHNWYPIWVIWLDSVLDLSGSLVSSLMFGDGLVFGLSYWHMAYSIYFYYTCIYLST